MPDEKLNLLSPAQERQNALSRWDNEGGAGPQGSQKGSTFVDLSEVPPLTNAELVQLRVRVIALENLMIMLLAEGPIGSWTLLVKWQPTSLRGRASPIIP
jgi:hypothetical protein